MPWWTIKYVDSGTVYTSDQVPFKLLPHIQEIDMERGHKFKNLNLSCEIMEGRIRLDLYSGALWVDGKLVAGVPGATRLVLHKRNFHPSHGATAYQHVHAGLVDEDGAGYLVRVTENSEIYVERCVVSAYYGQMVR